MLKEELQRLHAALLTIYRAAEHIVDQAHLTAAWGHIEGLRTHLEGLEATPEAEPPEVEMEQHRGPDGRFDGGDPTAAGTTQTAADAAGGTISN